MPNCRPQFDLRMLVVVLLCVALTFYIVSWSAGSDDRARVANSTESRASPTLQFVVVVSRHGNRAPMFSFPSNPYTADNTTLWPYGRDQLTLEGRVQMYNLGAKIRAMYDGFLDKFYFSEDLKAVSTVSDRTLMSAEAFLAGLFPPRDFQVWNPGLLWQPVPVFHTYIDHTKLLAGDPSAICPRFAVAQRESVRQFVEQYGSDMMALLEEVQPFTGQPLPPQNYILGLRALWDPLICADFEGFELPSWADKVYPERLEDLMTKADVSCTIGTGQMLRFLQGELFKEIIGFMKEKIAGTLTPARRMYYYSGHDMTIRGLLGILGLREELGMIKSGSCIVFELHQDPRTRDYTVQVLYIDGGSRNLSPVAIDILGLDHRCDFHFLANKTEEYYNITDYYSECQL